MLLVRVELHSAITGRVTELARLKIANDGSGNKDYGNYYCDTFRGRDSDALDKAHPLRHGGVKMFPRLRKHVWYLVCQCLQSMDYDK